MKKVELIVCDDCGGYETEVYVEIPDELYMAMNTDEIAAWVVENAGDNVNANAMYIGVLNWDPDGFGEEDVGGESILDSGSHLYND